MNIGKHIICRQVGAIDAYNRKKSSIQCLKLYNVGTSQMLYFF